MRHALGVILLFVLVSAQAAPVSLTQEQSITSDGQSFDFQFLSLPSSDGSGGQFSITLSGDYSPRTPPPLSEGSIVSLDIAAGTVELYNSSSSAAIFSNTVNGLSLNSTNFSGGGNNVTLGYIFDMNAALLDSILLDSIFSVSVQNSSDVNSSFGGSVAVGIAYNIVPIPAAVWLFGSALAGLGWIRRRQTA
jgi:hypothetical protein